METSNKNDEQTGPEPSIFSANGGTDSIENRRGKGNALEADWRSGRKGLLKSVVEVKYTTGKGRNLETFEVVGDVHGVRSTKRQRVLSGPQHTARRESAATAFGAA